ncbi:MAG: hypothetical protein R2751_09775 [Bacteroidales bacterium]
MEKRDYLLREIEKFSLLLQALLNRLEGRRDNPTLSVETDASEAEEELFRESGFELGGFLRMDGESSRDYLARFEGLNPANLELLAEVLTALGTPLKTENNRICLAKALDVLELCKSRDRTFSMDRELKIAEIRNALGG